jgi:transposase
MTSERKREASEKKRAACALKEQGLSYTQIAKRLDISPGEVFNRLYGWGNAGPHRLGEGARV